MQIWRGYGAFRRKDKSPLPLFAKEGVKKMLFAENGEKKILFAIVRPLQKYGIHPFRHSGLDPVERSGIYPT